jgi:hypothetical protein
MLYSLGNDKKVRKAIAAFDAGERSDASEQSFCWKVHRERRTARIFRKDYLFSLLSSGVSLHRPEIVSVDAQSYS